MQISKKMYYTIGAIIIFFGFVSWVIVVGQEVEQRESQVNQIDDDSNSIVEGDVFDDAVTYIDESLIPGEWTSGPNKLSFDIQQSFTKETNGSVVEEGTWYLSEALFGDGNDFYNLYLVTQSGETAKTYGIALLEDSVLELEDIATGESQVYSR